MPLSMANAPNEGRQYSVGTKIYSIQLQVKAHTLLEQMHKKREEKLLQEKNVARKKATIKSPQLEREKKKSWWSLE